MLVLLAGCVDGTLSAKANELRANARSNYQFTTPRFSTIGDEQNPFRGTNSNLSRFC